jgi:hypothetical protein
VFELDPAVWAKRDPRIVAECDAELTIATRLKAIMFVDGHGERGGGRNAAMGHGRGSRQCLDITDRRFLGASRKAYRAQDDDEGRPRSSHLRAFPLL